MAHMATHLARMKGKYSPVERRDAAASTSRCNPCCSTNTSKRQHTIARALYKSSRDTKFQIIETPKRHGVREYLQNVERIVDVTFPERDRRRAIGEGKWEITMLEQNFFGVVFAPSCDLRVWNTEEGKLKIEVRNIDLSDLPKEIQVPADIIVSGWMDANKREGSRIAHLVGEVQISLDVDVPFPYSSFPGLKETIETILSGVIGRLEGSLKRNLPMDYYSWAREEVKVVST